jgi:cytochrome c-type biogenesis protein CcmF
VGPPFFNAVNIPLGLLLLLLTGIGPLIAWRRASISNLQRQFLGPVIALITAPFILLLFGMRDFTAIIAYSFAAFVTMTLTQEFYKGIAARRRMYGETIPSAFARLIGRNRRRYGGYIVHMGIVVIFCAFAGLAFKKEYDLTFKPGDKRDVMDPWGHKWSFVSQGVSQYNALNREVTAIALDVSRDGQPAGVMTSEKRQHVDSRGAPTFEPSTEVGIKSSLRQDVYVVFAGVRGDESAEIRVTFNPLVTWVWLGGGLMAIGGLIVMWPQARKRKVQGGYAAKMEPSEPEEEPGELVGA